MPHKTIKKSECPHLGEMKITSTEKKACEKCGEKENWCWVCNAYLE